MPRFSIIIPTYNSAPTLRLLLESLREHVPEETEVIVVDDASTDDTAALVHSFPFRYERLPHNSGPAAARNRGAALAAGEWLLFTDADTVFLPDTMANINDVLASVPCDALVGSYAGTPANRGFVPPYKALWEYCTIDLALVLDAHGTAAYSTWAPRPGLVRRHAFQAIGGFNTGYRGADLEDLDFGYRLAAEGYSIRIAPKIRIRHHYPATMYKELKPFARRCAIWMRLGLNGQRFDSAGESSPRSALMHLVGFAAVWELLASLVWPILALTWLGLMLAYASLNRMFLREAWRRHGVGFACACLAYAWLHSIVLGFAAGYGALTFWRKV